MSNRSKGHSRQAFIVAIEDDPDVANLLSMVLKRHYRLLCVSSGPEALQLVEQEVPDLVLLDLILPGMDGFTVCRTLQRIAPNLPIIVVSGRASDQDKVRALDLGADDYLTKPFNVAELQARVRAVLRRTQRTHPATKAVPDVYEHGPLRIDFANRRVSLGDRMERLTPTEHNLLRMLVANAGKLLPHSVLLQQVWGPEYRSELDYLRVFIRRLRQKIEPNPETPTFIITEARAGYRFIEPHSGNGSASPVADSAEVPGSSSETRPTES